MKLFPAKCHEWATLRKLWCQTGNSSLLTAAARDGWNLSAVFKFCFCFVLFCCITNHLMTGPLWNSEFCFPRISMFPETKFSGNKIHFSPRDQSLTVNYGLTVSVHLVKYCYWPLPVIPLGNNKKVIECTTLDYDRTSKNKNYSTINHYSITNSCTFSVYSPNKCCITQQLHFFNKHIWSLCVDEISWSCSIPKYIVLGPNHKFSLPFYST